MGVYARERQKRLERQKAARKRIIIGLTVASTVVVVGGLCLYLFFGPLQGNSVVATVGGIDITADDVSPMIRQAEEKFRSENPDIFQVGNVEPNADFKGGLTIAEAIRQKAVRLAAVTLLLAQEAERLDISLSDEDFKELEEEISGIREQTNAQSTGGFQKALSEAGYRNENHLKINSQTNGLAQNVLKAIMDDPEEFAKFENLMEPEIIDDAEDRANEILARIRDGEDFDTLMFEYSEDPGLSEYPEGYTFGPGEFVSEFEETTRNLEIGEIEMVESQFGYHIIKRIEPDLEGRGSDEELLGAKHILISAANVPTLEERKGAAIRQGFETMVEEAEIKYAPILNRITVAL